MTDKNVAEHASQDKSSPAKLAITIGGIALAAFGIWWVGSTFLFRNYIIPSESMETTLMTGDIVFSEKLSYANGTPQRGDIVTFADPEDSSRTLIKRVIATGGQTVNIESGRVFVDGSPLVEEYTHSQLTFPLDNMTGKTITYPYTVPEGEIWVMGDNRDHSLDSRYFGSIPVDSVDGKAVFRYWPITSAGPIS